jgi:hypothetical protein
MLPKKAEGFMNASTDLGGCNHAMEQIGVMLLSGLENEGFLGDLYAASLATSLAANLLQSNE